MGFSYVEYNPEEKGMLLLGTNNDNMYSNGEFNLALNFIKRNDLILDVGANIGKWTKMALTIAPLDKIYIVEPIPDFCKHISLEHHFRKNIRIVNCAITDKIGESEFHIYSNNQQLSEMSNLFGRPIVEQNNNINVKNITIKTVTIDYLMQSEKIEKINYLKIDTEGAEEIVLNGSINALRNKLIDNIQFEYGGCFKDSGASLKRIFELLAKFGYSTFRILPEGLMYFPVWYDELENYVHSNYFAIANCNLKPTIFYN